MKILLHTCILLLQIGLLVSAFKCLLYVRDGPPLGTGVNSDTSRHMMEEKLGAPDVYDEETGRAVWVVDKGFPDWWEVEVVFDQRELPVFYSRI